jgi:signal transduction histidine kinase
MRQLFQNLLGNALKFYRLDEPLLVTVEHQLSGNVCEITVADNGIGFEQQYAERIFNVFERLHGRNAYPGTGVGLAICRRIAERHGGDIRAASQPGEGTQFIIRLLVTQPTDSYLGN